MQGNRYLTEEAVEQISSGKIYLGEQAKSLGLIDEFGGREKAFELAAKKAGITRYGIILYTKKFEKHRRKRLAGLLDFF